MVSSALALLCSKHCTYVASAASVACVAINAHVKPAGQLMIIVAGSMDHTGALLDSSGCLDRCIAQILTAQSTTSSVSTSEPGHMCDKGIV